MIHCISLWLKTKWEIPNLCFDICCCCNQTCIRLQVFVISLLFWPAFNWWFFLEKKNSTGCLVKTKCWWQNWSLQFDEKSSHFVFGRQPADFSSPKICQMVKITKMMTWSLVQVWFQFENTSLTSSLFKLQQQQKSKQIFLVRGWYNETNQRGHVTWI